MAENTSNNPTLLDLAKVKDPDGSIAAGVQNLQPHKQKPPPDPLSPGKPTKPRQNPAIRS